jgi:tripartite-type tricarboxylate transporter receptor subunit TctC
MHIRHRSTVIWSLALLLGGAGVAIAQSYPYKPIRIVTTTAGGGTDFLARIIGHGISGPLGQPVVIDNRPAGFIPGQIVAMAPPDGYTLLVSGTTFYVATLLQQAPYDPIAGFSPISLVSLEPNILVVHPAVAANSVKELIALAKSKPGVFNYSSQGSGSPSHLAAELFNSMTGVHLVHIPYKGVPQVLADLLSGQVQIRFGSLGPVVPHAKSGKLRALAVTGTQPSALFPGLPTVAATVPGYEMSSGAFIFAPARTPAAVIDRLNQEVVRVLNQPETKEKVFSSGQEIVASSARELAAYLTSDMARIGKVIKGAGIKAE